MFSIESRGSQCMANALFALIFAKYKELDTLQSLDSVLINGDLLYCKIISGLRAIAKFKSNLLNFDEIPTIVYMFNKVIIIEKADVISGVCTQQFSTSGLPTLCQALEFAFEKSSSLLLMIGAICSALFTKDNEYYFFDSHSHGSNGMSCIDGTSFLISFYCLEDLVIFLYTLYESMMIDISSQFDMLPIKLMMKSAEPEKVSPEVDILTSDMTHTAHVFEKDSQRIVCQSNVVNKKCQRVMKKKCQSLNKI